MIIVTILLAILSLSTAIYANSLEREIDKLNYKLSISRRKKGAL